MALQWLRSLFFNFCMYFAMLVLGIIYLPAALLTPDGALRACHAYCRWVIWSASWMVGLKVDVRGTPPTDPVLIAAKHQSFFDIIVIFHAVPAGRFIMKQLLMFAPILGQYALRIGCIPVNRGRRGKAIAAMQKRVAEGQVRPGQLIIYPQGTRVAPGAALPYKVGSAVLYDQLGQDCVPVATNIGVFWPKRGVLRCPGTAVVEFLPRIPSGLPRDAFLKKLETEVEDRSNALMREAGFEQSP